MLENLVHKIFHLFTKMKYINCQNTYINLILELVKITIQLQNIPTIYLFSIEYFLTKIPFTLQNIAYFTKLVQKFCTTFSIQTIEPHETLWYILLFSVLSYFYLVYVPKHSRISRQNKQCICNCIDNQHTISCSITDVYRAQQLKKTIVKSSSRNFCAPSLILPNCALK